MTTTSASCYLQPVRKKSRKELPCSFLQTSMGVLYILFFFQCERCLVATCPPTNNFKLTATCFSTSPFLTFDGRTGSYQYPLNLSLLMCYRWEKYFYFTFLMSIIWIAIYAYFMVSALNEHENSKKHRC